MRFHVNGLWVRRTQRGGLALLKYSSWCWRLVPLFEWTKDNFLIQVCQQVISCSIFLWQLYTLTSPDRCNRILQPDVNAA